MSPDNKIFLNLRRIAERAAIKRQFDSIRAAERLRIDTERIAAAQVAEDLRRQRINEQHARSREYMDRSDFPGLIAELEGIYNSIGRGDMVSVREGWYYRKTMDGGYSTLYYPPIMPSDGTSSIGVNWSIPSEYTLGIGRFSRTFRRVNVFGLIVIADRAGSITLLGRESVVLKEEDWIGNSKLQEDALNIMFENPFTPAPITEKVPGEAPRMER